MNDDPKTTINSPEKNASFPGKWLSRLFLVGGVLLPAAALITELTTRICAENLFDPLPTAWHVLMVAFVPATNLQTWLAYRSGNTVRPIWLSFANAVTICISLYYSLVFIPIIPLAVIAILIVFLGLLPLSPFFSLISSVIMRIKMRQLFLSPASGWFQWKTFAAGFLFSVAFIGLSEANFTITRIGIARSNSTDAETQRSGIALLRRFGDKDHLLRLSYDGGSAVTTDLLYRLFVTETRDRDADRSLSSQAQKAYYRITGKSYREVPTPHGVRNWERIEAFDDLDENGTFRVNSGLSLSASQMNGSVDSDASLAYFEWTMVFKNESVRQQEAVSQIQLPPGAVVSRLTLWINGEEREAAFARSAKVIEAYDTVTATRRDPALVTTVGKDRVQLKCFPVPANGEMKVRLGITAPVMLENPSSGFLSVPHFQDRNFSIASAHSIWVESKNELNISNSTFRNERTDSLFSIRGQISDEELIKIGSPIMVSRTKEVTTAWTKYPSLKDSVVWQEIKEVPRSPLKKVVFVIDPTSQMAVHQPEIANSISQLPANTQVALVLAGGNGLNLDIAGSNSFEGGAKEVAEKIRAATFDGGVDPVSAIETAWEIAQTTPGSGIVWIHGPQMVDLDSPERLTHLWKRRPNEVPLYSIQVGAGRNKIERALDESGAVLTTIRYGNIADDLARLFERTTVPHASFVALRTAVKAQDVNTKNSKETSKHLIRLWANEESNRLLAKGQETQAIDLAVQNQLVTRVSGAVVLETQAQYDQFGLKPVDPASVPTIPEPHDYLLLAIVAIVMLYFGWRYRRFRIVSE